MQVVQSPLVKGRYLHYSELLHHEPPEGLSVDAWWLGLDLLRSSGAIELPLVDKSNNRFRFLPLAQVQEHLHHIDMEAGGQIGMQEQITNPETRKQYCVRSLFEEAITSSQLEGAVTTRKEAKEMLRQKRRPTDRSEQMILNNYMTMTQLSQWKDEPLSREIVIEIQRMITVDALDDPSAAGRFRRSDEPIVVGPARVDTVFHDPPPADQLEARMERLCAFANTESDETFIHPVVRAIALHFMIGYDHPFVDGNGRTARAVFYWSMLRAGYWLMEFISISQIINRARARYERAFLFSEQGPPDVTYFLLYHLDVIRAALRELHRYIDVRTRELSRLDRRLATMGELNHRQRALVSHALRHLGQEYTLYGHAKSHGVTHQTARNDLLDLVERGLFTRRKQGRHWRFTPATDLEARLSPDQSGS
ncbi:MAG: Fic family protein [Deltaproteobacteria bacterium]|nr:Fic family protein [Deltaproteobacteria bacterium]